MYLARSSSVISVFSVVKALRWLNRDYGYGIFFEHGTGNEANTGSLEASSPLILGMTQRFPVSYPCIGNAPRGLTFRNAGRNYLNNPGRLNFDMTLMKHFKLHEGINAEFRAEAFNVFNHTQFRIYDPDNPGSTGNNIINCYAGPLNSAGFQAKGGADCLTGAPFLHPINAHRPRTMQFGLKISF